MANPSSQRLNRPTLRKDFQLVTCKGMEKRPVPEYLLAPGHNIFLFDTEWEASHMFSIPPYEIWSCGPRHILHGSLHGPSAPPSTPPSYHPLICFGFFCLFFWLFVCVFLFRAASLAYGSFYARGPIRAISAGLQHSHGNTGCKPHLWPTPSDP